MAAMRISRGGRRPMRSAAMDAPRRADELLAANRVVDGQHGREFGHLHAHRGPSGFDSFPARRGQENEHHLT